MFGKMVVLFKNSTFLWTSKYRFPLLFAGVTFMKNIKRWIPKLPLGTD
jgi:hypothetical protein